MRSFSSSGFCKNAFAQNCGVASPRLGVGLAALLVTGLLGFGCKEEELELFEYTNVETAAGFIQACAASELPEALAFVCEMEQATGWFQSGCTSVTSVLDSCTSNGQIYRQELCGQLQSQSKSAIATLRQVDGSGRVDSLLIRDAEFRFGRPFEDEMDQWQAEFEAAGCIASPRTTTFDAVVWQSFQCDNWTGYVEVVSESAEVMALWVGASRPGAVECLVTQDD